MTDKTCNKAKLWIQQKHHVETLGDLLGVKQHHWNTGVKENHQLNSVGGETFISSSPDRLHDVEMILICSASDNEFDALYKFAFLWSLYTLTLVLLNKLRCHAHF